VAVWPPDEVLDLVAGLPRPGIDGLRWTGRDQWHVTLRFLGPVADVAPAADALAALEGVGPLTAVLGPAVERFDQRVLHMPVGGLEPVAVAVAGATGHLGKPPDAGPFHGHLTLARVAKHAKVDLRRLVGAPMEARWPVDAVCLVESHLSPAGARYEVLDRFPLSNR
jgi:2'-5' RNA ligase